MVLVFLADEFEEVEALAPVDVLRRGEVDVKTVGVGSKVVTSSHGVPVVADLEEKDIRDMGLIEELDMVVRPGGMPGTRNLEKSEVVRRYVTFAAEHDRWVCAICAAPSVLGNMGLLQGKEAICFPGFEAHLTGAKLSAKHVCRDGRFITAKGAGVATQFGLELLSCLRGEERAQAVRKSIQWPDTI